MTLGIAGVILPEISQRVEVFRWIMGGDFRSFFYFQMVELIILVDFFLIYPDAMQICVQLYHIIDLR